MTPTGPFPGWEAIAYSTDVGGGGDAQMLGGQARTLNEFFDEMSLAYSFMFREHVRV